MASKSLDPRRAIENCIFHLHSWRPFQIQSKTLGSDSPKPYASPPQGNAFFSKRPCRADRATAFPVDALDMSKLSLFEEDRPLSVRKRDRTHWIAGKRRRRGSRSVSGRSSERSGTRLRCCSVGASAACGTCSDLPMAPGTDTSGELFVNGDVNWASDASEAAAAAAARPSRRERDCGIADRESSSGSALHIGIAECQGNESGYGSEPGYRGDGEIGYGDEIDEEEEEDQRLLFWGHEFGASKAERMGKNAAQKAHHRCRRRKHEIKMVDLAR